MSDHTDLTDSVCALLCEAVLRGAKPTRACIAAGFHKNTWSNWCRKADEGIEPYAERVAAILKAEAMCISGVEDALKAATLTDWRAAQAFLQSRAREDYGQKVEVTATSKPPEEMTREELLAIAAGKPVALPR